MSRFTLPRDIYHGKGCLEELKNLKGKKAILVVGGGSMKRQGFLDRAENYLKEAGMEVKLFEGVEPDPSVETVMKGAAVMQEFQPDWIVAMGGGSPIDAAKAMWAFYEYPDVTFEDLCIPFNFPELRTKAKFAAIPSTSGTATEVTGRCNCRPGSCHGSPGKAGCLHRYGCTDTCDRSLCIYLELSIYRSACTAGNRDGSGLPSGILQM